MRACRKLRSIQLLNFLVLSLMVVTLAYAETPPPKQAHPKPCGPPQMSVPPKTKDTLVSDLKVPEPSTSAMTPPRLVYSVDPMFPSGLSNSALAAGAIVVVTLTVDEEGKPQQVHVVCSSYPAFVANAIKAVKQYRFKPARLKGKPVPVEVNVETNFQGADSP